MSRQQEILGKGSAVTRAFKRFIFDNTGSSFDQTYTHHYAMRAPLIPAGVGLVAAQGIDNLGIAEKVNAAVPFGAGVFLAGLFVGGIITLNPIIVGTGLIGLAGTVIASKLHLPEAVVLGLTGAAGVVGGAAAYGLAYGVEKGINAVKSVVSPRRGNGIKISA